MREVLNLYRFLKLAQQFESESRSLASDYHDNNKGLEAVSHFDAGTGLTSKAFGRVIGIESNIAFIFNEQEINYSLTWSVTVQFNYSRIMVYGAVVGLYGDYPYQSAIEFFGPYHCDDIDDTLTTLESVNAFVLSNLAHHLKKNDLLEFLTNGQKAPFFSNM